jgi:hypothetical protein
VRERKEVQEVLRRLKPAIPTTAPHTHARRFRTDTSTPRKLNLRKLPCGDGINRGGLQETEEKMEQMRQRLG